MISCTACYFAVRGGTWAKIVSKYGTQEVFLSGLIACYTCIRETAIVLEIARKVFAKQGASPTDPNDLHRLSFHHVRAVGV